MTTTKADTDAVEAFMERWERSGAAERSNHQLFISELCDLLGVPHPDPATPDNSKNSYIFERSITFQHGDGTSSTGFIDLYISKARKDRVKEILETLVNLGQARETTPGQFAA
jgi:hypothetical protein